MSEAVAHSAQSLKPDIAEVQMPTGLGQVLGRLEDPLKNPLGGVLNPPVLPVRSFIGRELKSND